MGYQKRRTYRAPIPNQNQNLSSSLFGLRVALMRGKRAHQGQVIENKLSFKTFTIPAFDGAIACHP